MGVFLLDLKLFRVEDHEIARPDALITRATVVIFDPVDADLVEELARPLLVAAGEGDVEAHLLHAVAHQGVVHPVVRQVIELPPAQPGAARAPVWGLAVEDVLLESLTHMRALPGRRLVPIEEMLRARVDAHLEEAAGRIRLELVAVLIHEGDHALQLRVMVRPQLPHLRLALRRQIYAAHGNLVVRLSEPLSGVLEIVMVDLFERVRITAILQQVWRDIARMDVVGQRAVPVLSGQPLGHEGAAGEADSALRDRVAGEHVGVGACDVGMLGDIMAIAIHLLPLPGANGAVLELIKFVGRAVVGVEPRVDLAAAVEPPATGVYVRGEHMVSGDQRGRVRGDEAT